MNVLEKLFGEQKPLIAMCHLLGLPGRPTHNAAAGVQGIAEALAPDVEALQAAGVDGLLFCNEHDIPYSTSVGVEAAAAMAAVIGRLSPLIKVPFGVDLLWDARSSIAVARATGASFVREVFTGVYESDMGLFAPDLGEIAGYRHAIGADDVAIFANITPESSRSVSDRPVADRARGAVYMRVDALLISGPAAGAELDVSDLKAAKAAVGEFPVLANTGVRRENVAEMFSIADGAIVGTSMKVDGSTWNPVDPERANELVALVKAARSGGAK